MTLSKEWKDGILSIIMRGMSKNFKELGFNENQQAKWVCLDGDIDAVWIESMNTVMDSNKVCWVQCMSFKQCYVNILFGENYIYILYIYIKLVNIYNIYYIYIIWANYICSIISSNQNYT